MRPLRVMLVMFALMLSQLPAATAADESGFGEAWESVDCASFDVLEGLLPYVDCGFVSVPENRAAGSDRTIRLAVVRVNSPAEDPGTPVFLGTGGPGSDGLALAESGDVLGLYADTIEDRDWILFSQRGTRHAEPDLTCPELDAAPRVAAENGWSMEELSEYTADVMGTCVEAFQAEGIDLSGYNTDENAADVDAVREALGYDQIIYYGQSYGTLLGQFVMRNHPEILEGVILDGVASATFQHYEDYTQDASAAAFRQVFAACAADEACNEAYPDLETTLSGAFEALENDPQQLTVSLPAQMGGESFDVNVDGALAMEALFSSMFGGSATLPATIAGMAEGDFSLLAPDVGHFFAPGNFSYPMHLAVFCSDDPISPLDEVLDVDVPEMYLARTESDSIKYVIGCPMIDVSRLPDSSDELVRSDLPVLLMSGGLDPATPAENAEEVLTGLPNGDHVVFPGGGHIQGVNACGASLIDAFAMDPTAELDTSCAAAQSPVAFTFVYREPQAVTITGEDGSPVVALEVPAGFWQTGPQSWTNGVFSAFVTPFPAGTSADEALDRIVQANGIADAEFTDGPELLGQTSRELREEVAIQGTSQVVKAVAVETEGGTIRFATNFTGGADAVEAEFDALVQTATTP